MLKALVPVDGSPISLAAIRHVIRLVNEREPLEIHLLNVQAPVHGDVTMFIGATTVKAFHDDEGAKALVAACRLLDEARVEYTRHVAVGHTAAVIAAWAHRLQCDSVIMGTRGLGTLPHLLLGSVTHDVIRQLDAAIPVTLVKNGCEGFAGEGRR
jgi:nucleotide-binding universal stress UspA family protein